MKKIIAAGLILASIAAAQTAAPAKSVKHQKLHKFAQTITKDAKIAGTVTGSVALVGLMVVGSHGVNVKVY